MDREIISRTAMILGDEAIARLGSSRVAVFGIGGVGSFVVEALARAGVGTLDLIDSDKVAKSNINRQLIALHSTIGRYKTEVAAERVKDINPDASVNEYRCFYLPEEEDKFPFADYDYIVDAVDTVTAKIGLAKAGQKYGVPVISIMGTGNKIDPSMFEVCDIYKTSVCPLAKVMRRELKKRGITKLKCVYSKEIPMKHKPGSSEDARTPGSVSFTPPVAGMIAASEVIKDITGITNSEG